MRSELVGDRSEARSVLGKAGLDKVVRYRQNGCTLYYSNIKTIHGRTAKRCTGIGDNSIITLFDKTPYPTRPTDVVCPHFMELKWANGCRFDCAWCYLNGTFRFRPNGKRPYLKDRDKIIKHIKAFLEGVKTPTILNSGELSDSLVYEGSDFSLTKDIVPLFRGQGRHRLLIVTKSVSVGNLLRSGAQEQVIASFSVNAEKVSRRWEHKTPGPKERIEAAARLADEGYEVRLRIDPMVPIEGWKEEYGELVDHIFSLFRPERITLGTLRGLQSTLVHSRDTSWAEYLDDNSNWGKKINHGTRNEMYSHLMTVLSDRHDYRYVGICKETRGMLRELNIDPRRMKCNCIP